MRRKQLPTARVMSHQFWREESLLKCQIATTQAVDPQIQVKKNSGPSEEGLCVLALGTKWRIEGAKFVRLLKGLFFWDTEQKLVFGPYIVQILEYFDGFSSTGLVKVGFLNVSIFQFSGIQIPIAH
jgi:hypothetical protein